MTAMRQLRTIDEMLVILAHTVSSAGCFPSDHKLVIVRIAADASGHNWSAKMLSDDRKDRIACCDIFPLAIADLMDRYSLSPA
jgi:hypothetical protein